MSAFHKKYISQNAGLSYRAFLAHFQDQARGAHSVRLLGKSPVTRGLKSRFATPLCHDGLILVDQTDRDIENKRGESIPRLEIVDPNEMGRRRALDEMSQREQDKKTASDGVKRVKKTKRAHSSSGSRKRRTTSPRRKRKKTQKNKLKDLFDE